MQQKYPIGVFDSGYGGLTVLKEFVQDLPEYDFIYLGDNARAPYGNLSYETVYAYTLECVKHLFDMGCRLVILACNTASSKALRSIQQKDLPIINDGKRVLGVIRPTSEKIGEFTTTNQIGIFATTGTVKSESYKLEIEKFYPNIKVYQEACPDWVTLVENNAFNTPEADASIKLHIENLLAQSEEIDTIILGCTHFPLLMPKISQYLPENIRVISQGEIVSNALVDYLNRHIEINSACSKKGTLQFYTTGNTENFDTHAAVFFGKTIQSKFLML